MERPRGLFLIHSMILAWLLCAQVTKADHNQSKLHLTGRGRVTFGDRGAAAEFERQKAEVAKDLKAVEQQIIEKKKLIEEKEYAYQQFIKEKLMIEEKLMIKEKLINDKVGRKIFEEDAKVRQIEMEKKREQREYIQG